MKIEELEAKVPGLIPKTSRDAFTMLQFCSQSRPAWLWGNPEESDGFPDPTDVVRVATKARIQFLREAEFTTPWWIIFKRAWLWYVDSGEVTPHEYF